MLVICARLTFADLAPEPSASDVEWQIKNLGSDSRILKELAFEKLAGLGPAARDQLIHALFSHKPSVARRINDLLLKMPWTDPADPPETVNILRDYGDRSLSDRVEAGARLLSMPIQKSVPIFVRLIAYDPNDSVCWQHTTKLKPYLSKCREQLQQLTANLPPRPSTLRLRAWLDTQRSAEYLEQAVTAARDRVKFGTAEQAPQVLELATRELAGLYRTQKRHGDVEKVWRRQADEMHDAEAALELMSLCIDRGQPQKAEEEWRRYNDLLAGDPRATYIAARAAAAMGDHLRELDLAATARSLRANEPDKHFAVGRYLMRRGWLDWAVAEFQQVLQRLPLNFETHFQLANVFEHRRDEVQQSVELETALHLKEAQVQRGEGGDEATELIKDLKCRLLLLQAKREKTEGQLDAQERTLREALTLWPQHPDVIISLVELLRTRDQAGEAQGLVDSARTFYRGQIERQPDSPEGYNNLAWLLSNTGMYLTEARRLAQKALELAPDTAAYLDTLAEVHLRLNQPDRSVELQKQAVELEPDSLDLVERLKRFEDAAAKHKP